MVRTSLNDPAPVSLLRAAGRCVLVALALPIGLVGGRVLTAAPGYGRRRRGAVALQGFSRLVLRALGIRLVSQGLPRSGPSLVVANRVCWLDVLVLAAAGPIVPLLDESVLQRPIGPTAIRFGAMFFPPEVSRDLSASVQRVTSALRSGHRVLVFQECGPAQPSAQGPSRAREPFARAAFQAAVDAAVVVSPVALRYSIPPVPSPRADDSFGSIWQILRSSPLTVRVTWLAVIPAVAGPGHRAGHRAAAARRTEWAIDRALGRKLLTGTVPLPAIVPLPATVPVPALALTS